MQITITNTEFDLLRQLIEQECGIELGEDKVYLIETRLSKMVMENGCDTFSEFYTMAKGNITLTNKIIDAMTTNETLWFRDASPFTALKENIFPKFIEQLRKGEKNEIRVWSAACSTGQEPYSIGINAHEYAKSGGGSELANGRMKILATDISPTALFLAKAGRYDSLSLSRGMPEDLKMKYFEESGKVFVIKDSIKNMVEFQQINLFKNFSQLGYFDLIMLRNVAIYFSKDFKIDLFRRLAKALKPGGYLILGASESLYGYSDDFERHQHGNAQFYQVKQSVRTSA